MTTPSDVPTQTRYFEVPGQLGRRAAAWLGESHPEPPPAKPSSTVMLVRDGAAGAGLEVFMLRRVSTMAFAPSNLVFPGGGVDVRDADEDLPWCGPSPREWMAALLCRDEKEARELVIAAARELFEECGVLLAGPDPQTVVADLTGEEWDEERRALLSRDQSFAQLLIRRGLLLRSDLLRAKAHWITPEFEPRRYDTRFFAALVPQGQVPDDRSSEADAADWVNAGALLRAYHGGRAAMLPPTLVCIEQVAAAASAHDFLEHGPAMLPVLPVLESGPEGTRLVMDLPR